MPATPLRTQRLAGEPPALLTPLLPTVVVGSYKGGVWKTGLSVAVAERLALAGLKVLLVTCDKQEDARSRLGVKASDPQVSRVACGTGSVTVLGARDSKAVELLYRLGPERLGFGAFDIAVVDTPPVEQGGSLPGVLLIATVDGTDAARNLITMLRGTPSNTDVVLVKVNRKDLDEWAQDVAAIQKAAGRSMQYLADPLPKATPVKEAHDNGRSVWALPRRGCTLEFLSGVDTLAQVAWGRITPKRPWPPMPPPGAASVYVPGWDDDEA